MQYKVTMKKLGETWIYGKSSRYPDDGPCWYDLGSAKPVYMSAPEVCSLIQMEDERPNNNFCMIVEAEGFPE